MAEENETQEQKKKFSMKITPWHALSIVLVVILIVSIATSGFGITGAAAAPTKKNGAVISTQEASSKCISYVNNMLQGQATVKVSDVQDIGDLYQMKLDIGGQKYDSYMTKDGQLLFPTVINLSQPLPAQEQPKIQDIPKTNAPNVKFFVMSFCPYGQQAENGLGPVYNVLGSKIQMEPHYVIYSNYQGGGPNYCMDNESKYCSMHGIQEVNENVRQLCIYKNYNMTTWWNYVNKINSQCNSQNVDTCWEGVANSTGINVTKIKDCQKNEALTLLANEVSLNDKYGVQSSPQVFINDVEYQGGRAPANFQSAICSAFNTAPSECSQQLSGTAGAASGGCG